MTLVPDPLSFCRLRIPAPCSNKAKQLTSHAERGTTLRRLDTLLEIRYELGIPERKGRLNFIHSLQMALLSISRRALLPSIPAYG